MREIEREVGSSMEKREEVAAEEEIDCGKLRVAYYLLHLNHKFTFRLLTPTLFIATCTAS